MIIHRIAIILFGFIALLFSALAFVLIYGALWWALWFVSSRFLDEPYPLYVTGAVSLVIFIRATITAIRGNIPGLANLEWDSGTAHDAPSAFHLRRGGGRLWNVNPLGAGSIASVARLASIAFCLPQGMCIAIIQSGRAGMRRKDEVGPSQ